jgi:hypothetical protein
MLNKSHESWMNVQWRCLNMHLDETDVKTLKALTAKARLSSRQVDKQCDISIGTTPDQKREFIVQK